MDTNEYLREILKRQTLSSDSEEMKELIAKRDEVENILCEAFSGSATIKYGGSKAKHTMIRESYDLDIICYFDRDDESAGTTLQEIYESVKTALSEYYLVMPKTSALRLEEGQVGKRYTHVDVVPGRFTDDTKTDTFLYQNGGEKNRLKTNTKTHIKHIRDSGLTDAIRLLKLWRERGGFSFKTFVLELLVVKVLSSSKDKSLADQLTLFWEEVRDNLDNISVEDPANPSGNDLSDIFNQAKPRLKLAGESTLQTIETWGWENVFGELEDTESEAKKSAAIKAIPTLKSQGSKPWSP